MLRKRQQRGFMWAAAIAFGFASVLSWWNALEDHDGGASLVAPIGLTVAAFIWLVNVLLARIAAKAAEGNDQ
jgi:hypothetical protein